LTFNCVGNPHISRQLSQEDSHQNEEWDFEEGAKEEQTSRPRVTFDRPLIVPDSWKQEPEESATLQRNSVASLNGVGSSTSAASRASVASQQEGSTDGSQSLPRKSRFFVDNPNAMQQSNRTESTTSTSTEASLPIPGSPQLLPAGPMKKGRFSVMDSATPKDGFPANTAAAGSVASTPSQPLQTPLLQAELQKEDAIATIAASSSVISIECKLPLS
jgi:hypothetical protein